MPDSEFIVPIPGVQIVRSEVTSLAVFLRCEVIRSPLVSCLECGGVSRVRAYAVRELKHTLWNGRLVLLHLRVPKMECRGCGRFFMLPVPGVLPKKRATEQFRREVFTLHQGGIAQSQLAVTHSIGAATVERWYHDFVAYRVKELDRRACPVILGIDEHFFTRKQGYATTFVDLKNHKVFDVVLGRSEASLRTFLERLPGRDRVRIVVMDLAETYRAIVRKYFPNALIVADRFHVIRLLNHHFLKVWQQLDPEGRKDRGLLSLMRRHAWKLSPEQEPKLQRYFDQIPGLRPVYEFKQDLARILLRKNLTQRETRDLIPQLLWHLNECLASPWPTLQAFGRTLQSWLEPIARMWRFSKSNGITEGLHNKMEMISRRAFGFRNFNNYRLRVIALCGWNGVFALRN